MILYFSHLINREERARSYRDLRRIVTRVTASYRDKDGYEYRKSFESYGEPTVPAKGTHAQLNKLKHQGVA